VVFPVDFELIEGFDVTFLVRLIKKCGHRSNLTPRLLRQRRAIALI